MITKFISPPPRAEDDEFEWSYTFDYEFKEFFPWEYKDGALRWSPRTHEGIAYALTGIKVSLRTNPKTGDTTIESFETDGKVYYAQ